MILIRREAKPDVGFRKILLHSFSGHDGHSQTVLRSRVALSGGRGVVSERLGEVDFNAAAVLQEHAEVVLGSWVALVGRLLKPSGGLAVVLIDP